MAIATLSVDLVARLAKFVGDLGKAARASEQTAQRINAAFGTVGAVLGTLGAGISVAGIVSIAKASIDSVDRLNDLKDATGASIENLSALEDVAARTGTSMDTVSTAVIKFNKALADAKPDSDAARALDAIGLSAKELKALDPAEALLKTAVALQGFADDGNKARLTQELFGKSLKEVAPFLKDLAEKGQLVATVTTAQAEAAEQFNKELFNMQKNVQDVARYLSSDLVTSINAAAKAMREGGLLEGFRTLVTGTDQFKNDKALVQQTDELLSLEKDIASLRSSGTALDSAAARKKEERLKVLREEIKLTMSYRQVLSGVASQADAVKPSVGSIPEKSKKTGAGKTRAEEITDAQRALSSYVDSLSRTLEKTEELTATEKALNFLRTQGVQGQVPQVRELVLGLAAQVDLEKELAERLKTKRQLAIDAGDAVAKSNEEYQTLLSRLLAATPTSQLAEQRKDVEVLTAEFEAGRISETLYLEAVSARLDIASEGYQKLSTFAERAAQNVQDALGNTLADVLQGNFENIGDSFTKLINRMVAEAAAAQIMESLFGKTESKGGARSGGAFSGVLESLFGNLFSFDGGGSTGGGPRSGGLDGRGGFLAMLHPQEDVFDRTRGQSAGGRAGNTVHVSITQQFAPGTTQQTTLQAAAAARRQLEAAGRNL